MAPTIAGLDVAGLLILVSSQHIVGVKWPFSSVSLLCALPLTSYLLLWLSSPLPPWTDRQQLAEQQQQSEATAISSIYPLMRAAHLLEGWAEAAQELDSFGGVEAAAGGADHKDGSSGRGKRPWPCFDASKSPQQQQEQSRSRLHDVGHALLKPLASWTPEKRAVAAAAAASWVAELARGQQLLASTLQRAEQAEMELAGLRLDGGRRCINGVGNNSSNSKAGLDGNNKGSSPLLLLSDTPTCAGEKSLSAADDYLYLHEHSAAHVLLGLQRFPLQPAITNVRQSFVRVLHCC